MVNRIRDPQKASRVPKKTFTDPGPWRVRVTSGIRTDPYGDAARGRIPASIPERTNSIFRYDFFEFPNFNQTYQSSFSFSMAAAFCDSAISANQVVVFSKTYCPYCTKAKKALDSIGAKYTVIEIENRKGKNLYRGCTNMTT